MNKVLYTIMAILFIGGLPLSLAAPSRRSVEEDGGARSQAQLANACKEDWNPNICCLTCPAGTYMKSPCTAAGQRGVCEECDYGTYSEHSNHLHQCLKCTKCHSDKKVVRECSSRSDTECQCKPGSFCAPDQACEVCKKCQSCKEDEKKVKNCTAISNTVCSKDPFQPTSGWGGAHIAWVIPIALAAGILIYYYFYKNPSKLPCRARGSARDTTAPTANGSLEERQNAQNNGVDPTTWTLLPNVVRLRSSTGEEDEDRGLGPSLPESNRTSQSSLPPHPQPSFMSPLCGPSPVGHGQTHGRNDDYFPQLSPLKGEEESLRKSFEYFEEMDVDYYKRFFRNLGLSQNAIKSTEQQGHEDRVHELLGVWLEKAGREASINVLLKELLALGQRLTADKIVKKAVASGCYEIRVEKEVDSNCN